jgi:hypothetical protein
MGVARYIVPGTPISSFKVCLCGKIVKVFHSSYQ